MEGLPGCVSLVWNPSGNGVGKEQYIYLGNFPPRAKALVGLKGERNETSSDLIFGADSLNVIYETSTSLANLRSFRVNDLWV
jgi:hypothetical protein